MLVKESNARKILFIYIRDLTEATTILFIPTVKFFFMVSFPAVKLANYFELAFAINTIVKNKT